ncbi:hypothetical protein PQQ52_30970 [Paraburkholderia sediminicola]|uniref:hypothetical protein n=1 Tax=Paraburkholderia sediminicola TaxID=458836 RepID=UPI0038B8A21E
MANNSRPCQAVFSNQAANFEHGRFARLRSDVHPAPSGRSTRGADRFIAARIGNKNGDVRFIADAT